MNNTHFDGRLKDNVPDSLCAAVVLNRENGKKFRFRSMESALNFADEKNAKMVEQELLPRYFVFAPNKLPDWYIKFFMN